MSYFFRWLKAAIFGYFWMPCPRCGRMFGGFEYRGSILISEHEGRVTCCLPDELGDAQLEKLRKVMEKENEDI